MTLDRRLPGDRGYERGDRVIVSSRGRETVLLVWEDLGRGLTLTSEDGYERALQGDPDAPLVGFPRRDVVGLAPLITRAADDPIP